jgi:hypothetical protein
MLRIVKCIDSVVEHAMYVIMFDSSETQSEQGFCFRQRAAVLATNFYFWSQIG